LNAEWRLGTNLDFIFPKRSHLAKNFATPFMERPGFLLTLLLAIAGNLADRTNLQFV
jgi:hypothetical protein